MNKLMKRKSEGKEGSNKNRINENKENFAETS